jgi:hypothetical protein
MYLRPRARRSTPGRPGRRARVRPAALASLAVIVGLLFAQLVQLSDLLLFQHTACEHGELVHARARGPVKVEAANDDESQRLGAAPAGEGDHEHCDALALRHHEGSVALHVPQATILVWLDSPVIVLGSPRRPIALLAVAPKASPPRG